jgi:Domain of unknown function (DUF4440)
MLKNQFRSITVMLLCITAVSCAAQKMAAEKLPPYKPGNPELYNTIVKLDSTFFAAYNTCNINLEQYAAFYSDSIEFYHDQGGLSSSKQEIVEGTKKNICGKVTRELVTGSMEVYPIIGFGAVEFGFHKFYNNQEPAGTVPKPGRFMILWENKNNEWKIKKVVSLH